MKLEDLSRNEVSLLLYLETRAVDYGGTVDPRHMNDLEFDIAETWWEAGFIEFGRLASSDVTPKRSHWVKLSDDAFKLAHEARIARAERMWKNRHWKKTSET